MLQLKKEQIKDRMIRLAARKWGMSENEIDANFDPLLALLMDALASELEHVGAHIKNVQSSLLDDFASLMMPMALLNAQPAHCILSTQPVENEAQLQCHHNFQATARCPKNNGTEWEDIALNFMPIGNVTLFKTSVRYMRIGQQVCEWKGPEPIVIANGAKAASINTIHFALDNIAALKSLSGLQLFFDLKGHSEASSFYKALQEAVILINGSEAQYYNGYYNQQQYAYGLEDVLENDFGYADKIRKSVAALYMPQFITLSSAAVPEVEDKVVTDFWGDTAENIVKKSTSTALIYGTILLKRPFPQEVAERLVITANAFPVINQQEEAIFFKTNKWVNVIPLPVKNGFLALKSIQSSEGKPYKYHVSRNDSDPTEGEALLRTSHTGSNGSKDIRKSVQALLESMRDESAFFSNISNSFIADHLQEISKMLTRLDDKIHTSKDLKQTHYYLLLKPHKAGNSVEIKYYVTDPVNAMQLKQATVFRPVRHTLTTTSHNSYAVTNAMGAIAHLSDRSARQYLLRQLSSKGKIISVEDIRHVCMQTIGENLVSVDVSRKMKVLQGTRQGIERIVAIDLHLRPGAFTDEQIYYHKQAILNELDKDAAFVYPFEITTRQ